MPYERDRVAPVTLNLPEKKNAMNPQLHRDMTAAIEELRYAEEKVGVSVISYAHAKENDPLVRRKGGWFEQGAGDFVEGLYKPGLGAHPKAQTGHRNPAQPLRLGLGQTATLGRHGRLRRNTPVARWHRADRRGGSGLHDFVAGRDLLSHLSQRRVRYQ